MKHSKLFNLCPFHKAGNHHQQDYTLKPINGLKPDEYVQCSYCKVVVSLNAKSTTYEENYFATEYSSQYGKSYLQDKTNIQKRMKWRLDQLEKHTTTKFDLNHGDENRQQQSTEKPQLLEIGSAAGFFLELCNDLGFHATGWEISQQMTNYANSKGWETIQGGFLRLSHNYHKNFALVAAFYVIEHFHDQYLLWKNITKLLKPGGYLLLSLPSSAGPVFKFNKKSWAQGHPRDHFVDYNPLALKKIGRMFGFSLILAKSEGVHPHRFPLGKSLPFSFIYRMYQKLKPFSDTLFVILQKNEHN